MLDFAPMHTLVLCAFIHVRFVICASLANVRMVGRLFDRHACAAGIWQRVLPRVEQREAQHPKLGYLPVSQAGCKQGALVALQLGYMMFVTYMSVEPLFKALPLGIMHAGLMLPIATACWASAHMASYFMGLIIDRTSLLEGVCCLENIIPLLALSQYVSDYHRQTFLMYFYLNK